MIAELKMKAQQFGKHVEPRLGITVRTAVLWTAFSGTATTIWTLPLSTSMIQDQGVIIWLCRGILSSFIPMFILALSIRASAGSGTELAQQPIRFLVALVIGATLAMTSSWLVDILFPFKSAFSLPARLAYWWLNWIVFGAIFGWAGVLDLQRREDQVKLDLLLNRRLLLARQLAQSQLLTARAQVDPEMVARILAVTRTRYCIDSKEAGNLLDHLIDYLRLAMHRVRERGHSIANELTLVRAYIALRQAETGAQIGLQVNGDHPPTDQLPLAPFPLFLIARQLVNEANLAQAIRMTLQIDISNQYTVMTIDIGNVAIQDEALARLRSNLRKISNGTIEFDILHHLVDSETNRYVLNARLI